MFIFTNENGTQVLQSGADLMHAASNVPCGTRVFVMHNEAGELVSAGRSAAEMARSEPIFKAMRNGAPLAKSATMDIDDAKIQANQSSHNQKQVKKTDVKKLVVLKAKKKAAAVADEDHQDDETEASEEMAKAFSGTRLGLLGIIAELQALKDQKATA
jgi:hypothetical protein